MPSMLKPLLLAALLSLPWPPALAADSLPAAVAAYQRGDLPRARTAFTQLAAQGVAAADYNLAVMHLRRELPRANDREALRHMTRAAEAGFVTAMVGLAELHEQGQAGLATDLAQAVQWQRRAAEAGSVDAQVALATAHYLGRGAPKDLALAARWYRVAAQGGDVGAMYLYASMVESGDGVERDLAEARYWYAAAARNGEPGADLKARELDAKLSKPAS
ncbi:MAG TPA: tetratricopeptide repeat protein [Burkholderiaceae bacterium]|nr:tetratricopeptide repeat protein [Burkholderiaceae bacterium]